MIYNRWKVLEDNIIINNRKYSHCLCDCGTKKLVQYAHLKNNTSKSCGCLRSEHGRSKKIDLVGQKFNRLLVIGEQLEKKCTDAVWICKCDCGNETNVKASKLKRGTTKSCGCFSKERFINDGIKWAKSEKGRKFRSLSNSSKIGDKALRWKGGNEREDIRLRYSIQLME